MDVAPKVYLDVKLHLVEEMFKEEGWEIVDDPVKSDLICFTGGSDVSPMLYGAMKHPKTHSSLERDEENHELYVGYEGLIPMAGICRGAQFLNVLNGGELFQDVNNHNISGTHKAFDWFSKEYQVTSTHHQMMIPSVHKKDAAEVLLYSTLSTRREFENTSKVLIKRLGELKDVEAVFYKETLSLCFQPHPEDVKKGHECRDLFFTYLDEYLELCSPVEGVK